MDYIDGGSMNDLRRHGIDPVRAQLTTSFPERAAASRPVSYYILLGVAGLALFAISMFLTILVLR